MTDVSSYTGNHDASEEDAARINATTRYVMYSVFMTKSELPQDRADLIAQTQDYLDSLAAEGVVIRGIYDVGGFRAEADLMVWWHSESAEKLQAAYRGLLRTPLGRHLEPVWSNMGVHRPSEFNKRHVPGFLTTEETSKFLCVYPFVRSYDWYVLEPEERSRMLKEHGMAARDFPDVRAHTVAAFALGDYEWLLAFEADEVHRIVDLMRELRAVDARLHVREEIPFFTGPKTTVADFAAAQR